jgi:phosphoglycerate dehydrogenase-like enzyme
MRVVGWSPHLTAERAAEAGVEFCATKEELLGVVDVVSIHMVLAESLITGKDLGRMRRTAFRMAFLINTSRGALVDEGALVAAQRAGGIAIVCGGDVGEL